MKGRIVCKISQQRTLRYDKLYLCAPKSWRTASLVYSTEPTNKKSDEEN